jgi:hypothetical protein
LQPLPDIRDNVKNEKTTLNFLLTTVALIGRILSGYIASSVHFFWIFLNKTRYYCNTLAEQHDT